MNCVENTTYKIIKAAGIDFGISDMFKGEYTSTPDVPPIYTALRAAGFSSGFDVNIASAQIRLNKILSMVLADPMLGVNIRQTTLNPYWFEVSVTGYSCYLPLICTRGLISALKGIAISPAFAKRVKSLTNPLAAMFTDLVCRGKDDLATGDFKPLADICKKFHGVVNPWSREPELITNPVETLNEENLRFRGADWFAHAMQNVTLVGCGGIGSWVASSLCRVMGDKQFNLYDPDIIEQRNLAGQDFSVLDVGKNKAKCLAERCQCLNPVMKTNACAYRFNLDCCTTPIVITGLDNMASRQMVYEVWSKALEKAEDKGNCLLIDGRLSAERWQIFCIQGNDKKAIEEYQDKWLFSDDEAESDVCSYKQTAFAAQMIASYMVNLYINFCANLAKTEDDPTRRFLPFLTEYDAAQMILRQKEAE